ncbi:MAG: nucleotidyltransferase family protein [Bacteroidota bacterium]
MKNRVPVVILAAGASSRMGQPKQLLQYKGRTLLQHAIQTASKAELHPIVVVLGAFQEEILPTIQGYPVEICMNSEWEEGMGSSLRAGIQYIQKAHPESTSCMFMLSDQPLITPTHLEHLQETLSNLGEGIVATKYHEITGVPMIFSAKYFPILAKAKGALGARKIVNSFPSALKRVPFEAAAQDVDTPEDYQNLIA